MDLLESIYETKTISKAWMLCGDDQEAQDATEWLSKHDHTVVLITTYDVEDERPLHMDKLHVFQSSARILVISYPAWATIEEAVQAHVLPFQDLTIFGRLEDDVVAFVKRRLGHAASRGLWTRAENATIVSLYPGE